MTFDVPRPVEVTSHQFHATGMCYGIFEDRQRDLVFALVEHDRGDLTRYDLFNHGLKFVDHSYFFNHSKVQPHD